MEILQVIFYILKLFIDLLLQVTPIVLEFNNLPIVLVAGLFGVPVLVIKMFKCLINKAMKIIKA